jgi:glycosyltransferase involved in cell wall biosynthesis
MVAKGLPEHSRRVRLTRLFERLTYRVAHVSIETNESYKEIALTRGGMSPENVFVVRSAPEITRFAGAVADAAWRRGRKHLVAYVGVMGIQDGLDYLIDAARVIVHDRGRDDIQFLCIGGGPELDRLRERVSALSLDTAMEFPGRLSDADLGAALATADVCVNPDEVNRMNDISTMNKIMEYMALSKPMVQFELREGRVSAGDASLYAAPNDADSLAENILRLVDDSHLADQMGRAGHDRLQDKLSWEAQVPILLASYDRARLLRRGARSGRR